MTGLTLFITYINDMPDVVVGMLKLFTDDTILRCSGPSRIPWIARLFKEI